MTLLRSGLLEGRAVALAGGVPGSVGDALSGLKARVVEFDSGLDEERAVEWAAGAAPLHALVYDAARAFDAGGRAGLAATLELAWVATRAVATGALIPGGTGKVLLIAPSSDAGEFASAAQAGLENLARTLSVEWARHGVTAVAIVPRAAVSQAALTELVCFLVSPAGDYFSGCRFDLGG